MATAKKDLESNFGVKVRVEMTIEILFHRKKRTILRAEYYSLLKKISEDCVNGTLSPVAVVHRSLRRHSKIIVILIKKTNFSK